jgi:hypothetical protein
MSAFCHSNSAPFGKLSQPDIIAQVTAYGVARCASRLTFIRDLLVEGANAAQN